MIQQSHQRYVLAFVLALAVLSVGVPATASAQEQPDNPLENETATEATDPTEVTEQLGRLVVHDYSYDGSRGVMTIEASWNGNVSTTVTITEMIQMDSGGAKEIGFKQIRIMPDQRRTIKISVEQQNSGSASVIVTTRQSIDAGRALVLQAGDASLDDVVKATVFVKDMRYYDEVNEVYGELMSPPYPARSAVEVVKLPVDIDVEIEVVAER